MDLFGKGEAGKHPASPFLFAATSRSAGYIPGLLTGVFLSLLYFRTLAPGLTWAFDGADGGDLITAAATGGVPHPTGYPTYLVLASVFLRIPIQSLAFRTNILSLMAGVAAACMIYALVLAASGSLLAASIASLAFGTAPLIWSQAIITEVYTLQALLVAGFLGLLLARRPRRFIELTLGLVAGLSLGNHLSSALMLPLLLLLPNSVAAGTQTNGAFHAAEPARALRVYAERLLGLCMGLSIYVVIAFRATSHAPVNWGYATSPGALLSLVSGEMYWSRFLHGGSAYVLYGMRSWAQLMVGQFSLLGLVLAIVGLIVLFRRELLHIATVWIAVSYSVLSILYYSPDSYVYLIPAIIACCIWIGLGSRWLVEWASRGVKYGGAVLLLAILAYFALRGFFAIPGMDLSQDRGAEDFARVILQAAPHNAILLTEGDESTFSLWYFHFALHERPDLAIVSSDLFAQPWYHAVLEDSYPGLIVPLESGAPALENANPGRSLCQVRSILQPRLECVGETNVPGGGTSSN